MANPEHLKTLNQGVKIWNKWREKNRNIWPDLKGAKLKGTNLLGANLKGANLKGADLSGVNLAYAILVEANLSGANLKEGDLMSANLIMANLSRCELGKVRMINASLSFANLRGANLIGAYLGDADMREADLRKVNLREVNLNRADLKGAKLDSADLTNGDLRSSCLIDAKLDGATFTGGKLWEVQKSGWSIKSVKCEYAFMDRDGVEKTSFEPGEFERLYSEKTKIVLLYKDHISPFEVLTLPALIQIIQNDHPGSFLHLRSIQEDAGGVSVIIDVDDLGTESLSKIQDYAEQLQRKTKELVDAQTENMLLQSNLHLLEKIIDKKMGDTYQISGPVNGPVGRQDGTAYNQNNNQNDLDAISKMVSEILAAKPEISKVLDPEKKEEFDGAVTFIETQLAEPKKDWAKLKQAAKTLKNVLTTTGDIAGKWMPIAEKLSEALHTAVMI